MNRRILSEHRLLPKLNQLIAAGLIVMWSGQVSSAEYYVYNAAQIHQLLGFLAPGDDVVMANGVWSNQDIHFAAFGTAANPITLRAAWKGRVILTGTSRLHISGDHLIVDGLRFQDGALSEGESIVEFRGSNGPARYSRLRKSAFIDYNPANPSTRYFWVSLYGQFNRVDRNFFKGQNHSGVTVMSWNELGVTPSHQIDRNHFVDRPSGPGSAPNGYETVKLGTGSVSELDADILVWGNLFERTNGEIEVISNKSSNSEISYNTFRNVEGTVTLRRGAGNRVTDNFFLGEYNQKAGGVRIIGADQTIVNNYFQDMGTRDGGVISIRRGQLNAPEGQYYQLVENALIAHNTIVNAQGPVIEMSSGSGSPAEDVVVANNIFQSGSPLFHGTEGPNWTWAGNIAYGPLGVSPPGTIAIDPELVFQNRTWRLSASSPAIGAAASGSWSNPSKDMDGQSRSAPLDIGADERLPSLPILRAPLSGSDVGPTWLSRRTFGYDSNGNDAIVIEAENFTQLTDPNGDSDTWSVVTESTASGSAVLKAPAGNIGTPLDAVAEYDIAFHDPGVYHLYLRVRGFSTASNSLFYPSDFWVDPTLVDNIGASGNWEWIKEASYTVSWGDVNRPLTLKIGKRERDTEIDMLILSPNPNLAPPL